MPPKLPLPAHDDITTSENDQIVADSDTDPVEAKPTKTAIDRRSKPRQAATTRKTKATASKKTALSTESSEATDEPWVDDEVAAEEQDVPNGVLSEVRGSAGPDPTVPSPAAAKIEQEEASPVTPLVPDARTAAPSVKESRGFGRRLLRLLGLGVVLGALAAAAYLIWPTINTRYIQPVENTAADLSTVQGQLGEMDSRLDSVTAELAENDERLSEVEAGQVLFAERLDELAVRIDQQTLRIENLDELAATLSADQETASSSAAQQVQATRAAERMSRARLFLFQANYGLAAADVQAARETLAAIDTESGDEYSEVIERLDRAIANLPEFPVAAAGDLDIAWEMLLGPGAGDVFSNAGDPGDTSSPDNSPAPDSDAAPDDDRDPTP